MRNQNLAPHQNQNLELQNPETLAHNRASLYSHAPIDFYFSHTSRDFVVSEIPLYEFSGSGEHRILQLRKKNLTTIEMLKILSASFGCPLSSIGYAGLKDKSATTTQFISLPNVYASDFESKIAHLNSNLDSDIKLISSTLHNNKLRLGHLKGNAFFVRLKHVNKLNATKLQRVIDEVGEFGFANFFGFQRFGTDGDNYKLGRDLAHKKASLKNRKIKDFLISSYQSYLFNQWLNKRIILSIYLHQFSAKEAQSALKTEGLDLSLDSIKAIQAQPQRFKLLGGELCCHYPYGKFFSLESCISKDQYMRFHNTGFSPTGALSGKNLQVAKYAAFEVEKIFLDSALSCIGSRRYAWVWASDISYTYKPEEAHFELSFSLPKGSYAPTFLEEISHNTFAKE